MERKRLFYDGQDNDPNDLNLLQTYAQDSLDHLVADAVTADRKYAGFAAAQTGVTQLTAQPGRLYAGGKVYVRDTVFVKDFTPNLPVATKKIALLVVFGSEADTDTQAREFLIDEETGASEPRVVAQRRDRIANVNTVVGQENADPLPPIVDAGVIVIAQVMLTPAGVASVTMNAENALDSIASVDTRVDLLEAFAGRAEPQIGSLASDIAALTKGQANLVSGEMYGRTLERMAVLEAKADIPAAAVDSSADFFLDLAKTDTAFAGYDALAQEGIRFAAAASATAELTLANPLNPAAKVVGDVLFPAYDRKLRQQVGPATGEVQISTYTYAAHALTQKSVSRIRIRYGTPKTVCTNSVWWKSGKYDAAANIFRINGEVWTVDAVDLAKVSQAHGFIRLTQYWEDTFEEPYWEQTTVDHVINGSQVAETFLQGNDMWLDAVGLTFTRLAADGTVTVSICETDRGMPVLDKVISKTTIARADLAVGVNVLPVQPVFLTGGVRYAIVVITSADHWIGTVEGSAFPQGTFFYVLDGAFQQGDATRDIAFSLYGAQFRASRAVLDLAPLQLAGGMAELDLIAPAIIPGSTQLSFEFQIGAVWYPLASTQDVVLGAGGVMPALLPFRAVFTGTPDVMPCIHLDGSQLTVSRPKTALTYISAIRNLPGAGSTQIRVSARLENFQGAHHTAVAKLLSGAGYATETAASSFADVVGEDGVTTRTWLFNLGGAVTTFRKKITATTDSALNVFHFAWTKDYAL